MKALITCGDRLLRDLCAHHLQHVSGISVDRADGYSEARGRIDEGAGYDVVLLDLALPGMLGLAGLRETCAQPEAHNVALLVRRLNPRIAAQAIATGARGVVPMALPSEQFVAAISAMAAGDSFVPDEVFMRDDEISGDVVDLSFSPREMQVLRLLGTGKSNKEIGRALVIRETTVKLHVNALTRKLGAANRTQAAIATRDVGLF